MSKNTLFICNILILACALACTNNSNLSSASKAAVIGSLHFNKSEGKDCNQPDSLRTNCASINLIWPNVEDSPEPLKRSVVGWTNQFLVGILLPASDDSTAATATVEQAALSFFQMHQEFAKEAPDAPLGHFIAESDYRTLLNDGKHLTLEMTGFVYAGGAHGNPVACVATFENETGKQLRWGDLVTDTTALKAVVEKKFRAERSDLFKPTDGSEPFEFDDIFKFDLPRNYGLMQEGIYCHYLHYEVGPYAIGNTQFIIPFSELEGLLKKG